MKITILIILITTPFLKLKSQNIVEQSQREMKYWKLRGRLIGDEYNRGVYNGFMIVGEQNGMSIPAVGRIPLAKRNPFNFNPLQTECNQHYIIVSGVNIKVFTESYSL